MSETWPTVPTPGTWTANTGTRIGAGVREPDAQATLSAKAVGFVVVALAFAALADTVGRFDVLAWTGAALWVGIALGEIPEIRALVARMPGWVIGLLTVGVLVFVWVLLASREVVEIFPPHVLLFAVVGMGLDWSWVTRLRGYIFASGFLVAGLVFEPDQGDVLLALAWLVAAIAGLWLLQRDSMQVWPRARPLRTGGAPPRSDDLLWVAGIAVTLGLLAAMLLGNPACQPPWRNDEANQFDLDDSQFDRSGNVDQGSGGFDPQQGSGSGERQPGGGAGSGSDPGDFSGGRGDPSDPSSGNGGSELGDPGESGDATATGSSDDSDSPNLWVILLAVVAAVALGALLLWWTRRRPELAAGETRPWAIDLARRLAVEGARRGRPRAASEPITAYAGALGDGPLDDPRLHDVGALLSAALFGRNEPPPSSRTWAEQVVDEALEEHPLEGSRAARKSG